MIPGVVGALNHHGPLANFVPIFVLLAAWLPAFFFLRNRDQKKIQQEIAELRAYEQAN